MAKKASFFSVDGTDIRLVSQGSDEYISLTDIDQRFEGNGRHIENWLRNQNTVEYLATWETLYNPAFNSMQLQGIREQIGINRFLLSAKKWVEMTNAIGIKASAGRYGGTFAHADIAFHFCLWLSPTFQLYVSKEFQRLKIEEAAGQKEALDWSLKRALSKVNYRIHTETVRQRLIPPRLGGSNRLAGVVYASEADLLNVALFGCTARDWQAQNPTLKGNLRDHATTEQLLVLANLESINSQLIRDGLAQDERLEKLNEVAIYQLELLTDSRILEVLRQLPGANE